MYTFWLMNAELTLIDAGLWGTAAALRRYLSRLGRDISELTRIVLTHGHRDHCRGLQDILAHSPAQVFVHVAETHLDPEGYPVLSTRLRWRRSLGTGKQTAVRPLEDGDEIPVFGGLRVIHTPGHTPGSICLLLPEPGIIFTGDTVFSRGGDLTRPVVPPGPGRSTWEASVQRIAALDFEIACFGHGAPLTEGVKERFQELLARPAQLSPPLLFLRRWRKILGFGLHVGRKR